MMTVLKIVRRIAVGCLALGSSVVFADAGDFDPSFNRVGFTRDSLGLGSAGRGLAIYSSGEIVTAGYYFTPTDPTEVRLVLWRHLPDGQLDAAFGDDGVVYPASTQLPNCCNANNLAVDNSERIVLLTITRDLRSFLVYRFNFDGSPDLTFSGDGSTTLPVGASIYPVIGVAIQPDDEIIGVGGAGNVVSRHVEFFVFRLQENGELDPSFAGKGSVFTSVTGVYDVATGVALQPDGKIAVAGRVRSVEPPSNYNFALVRYLSSGELDGDFGDGGKVTFSLLDDDIGRKLVIQPDGKIVIAGYTCEELTGLAGEYCYFGVARVDAAGALDPSFGGTGKVHTDVGDGFPYDVALQTDGKIVAVGLHLFDHQARAANTVLVRYLPDGSVDPTFGVNGISETNYGYAYNAAGDIRIQSDGNIVVAAVTSNVAVGVISRAVTARYLSDSGMASTPMLGAMPPSPLAP